MADLTIANTVSDLIQGDIREHLPLERIPLQGDVLGLGHGQPNQALPLGSQAELDGERGLLSLIP